MKLEITNQIRIRKARVTLVRAISERDWILARMMAAEIMILAGQLEQGIQDEWSGEIEADPVLLPF